MRGGKRADSARTRTARALGIAHAYADYRELLDNHELDGLVVATPHAFHYEIALAAVQKGLHVLVEKPMVLDPAHGRHLLSEARDM